MRILICSIALLIPVPAAAQALEASAHFAASQWSEFDGTDLGFGARVTFKPIALIGIDADLSWYPSEFPGEGTPFSERRFEGLFGVTVGPRLNRLRPFAKVAGGFINTNGTQTAVNVTAHATHAFTGPTRIGADPLGNDRIFNGKIDEVAVFNRALSAGELQFLATGLSDPNLRIGQVGNNLVLSWAAGVLLEANTITGPWTTNNAASPFTNAPSGTQKYYRVIVR